MIIRFNYLTHAFACFFVVFCSLSPSWSAGNKNEKLPNESPAKKRTILIPSEEFTDTTTHVEMPGDSILIAQIVSSKAFKDYKAPWNRSSTQNNPFHDLDISSKKQIPSGFIVESFWSGGAPCSHVQISSFDKRGTLLQVLPFLAGCDCPSECEGCETRKSIHWSSPTRFYIKKKSVIVLNRSEERTTLEIDDCEIKTIYAKTDCEINTQGEIIIGQEKKITRKEGLLIDLQGKHSLSSISGFSGANTLYDYTKTNDIWDAGGSSIHQAKREPFNIPLDTKQQALLNGLEIHVQKDLSIVVRANDTLILSIPFNPNGPLINLSGNTEGYVLRVPDSLNSSTAFVNEVLYLAVVDVIKGNMLSPIDVVIGISDAYKLTYNVLERQFELTLFYSNCCDNAIYLFNQY
jgi:hypothetical protein